MSRTARLLTTFCVLLMALVAVVVTGGLVDEVSDRVRASGGPTTPGVVVERERRRYDVVPDVVVAYSVGGRDHTRELDAFLDVGEQVDVRYLPSEPSVSRVEQAGVAGVVDEAVGAAVTGGMAAYGVVVLVRHRPRRRRERERPAQARVVETPEDRAARGRRLTRGATTGAISGVAVWGLLALWLGAGPLREVATAMLGTVGACAALGTLVALVRSRGELRRSGQAWAFRLGCAACVGAAVGVLVLAAALEA